HRDLDRDSVITLRRRRCDDLNVDAHGVEVRQSVIVTDPGANVGFLLLTERSGLGIGEMRQRYRCPIKIRFDEFRRRRHGYVAMHVGGLPLRPQPPPRPARAARGVSTIFVPLLRHAYPSLTRRTRRGSYRLDMKWEI